MGTSYRQAWLLVDDLNRRFRQPVVTKQLGGTRGGGAMLTDFGRRLIAHYRAIEDRSTKASSPPLRALEGAVSSRPTGRISAKSRDAEDSAAFRRRRLRTR
jgi:molybdate transport system regulatory protein